MEPDQMELGRHALGFQRPGQRVSYRNHFVAGPGHDDYETWMKMVRLGFATRRATPAGYGGDDIFRLTLNAAKACLRGNERLDLEDFPKEVQ